MIIRYLTVVEKYELGGHKKGAFRKIFERHERDVGNHSWISHNDGTGDMYMSPNFRVLNSKEV